MGMIRGRKPAGGGVRNPPSRGAVYDQRTYGSVGAGAGNRPGYPSDEPIRPTASLASSSPSTDSHRQWTEERGPSTGSRRDGYGLGRARCGAPD